MRLRPAIISLFSVFLLTACGLPADPLHPARNTDSAAAPFAPDARPVRLVWADTVLACSSCVSARIYIDTLAAPGRNSTVSVVYSADGGPWTEASAAPYAQVGDRQIWRASELGGFETRFALRYTVDGVDYWDNNGGWDYRLRADNPGRGNGFETVEAPLGPDRNVAVVRAAVASGDLDVSLHVRNLAYEKNVRILFTFDEWQTVGLAWAAYDFDLGGQVEKWLVWGIPVPDDATALELAAVATMNDEDSWDNGYGQNVRCERNASGYWDCSSPTL